MTDEQLAAIRQRVDAVTSGPWTYDAWPGGVYAGENSSDLVACDGSEADMVFIAHAPEDMRALLAEVDALRTIVRIVADTSLFEVRRHPYLTGVGFATTIYSDTNIVLDARAAMGTQEA